jgi:hypothetical protein
MDAQDFPARSSRQARRIERVSFWAISVTIAAGLWQAYGGWLLGAHVR